MDDQNRMTEEELLALAQDQQEPQVDPQFEAAREQRDKMNLYGNLLGSFQNLIQGTTGAQADMSVANNLRAQGQQAVKDVQTDRQMQRQDKQDQMAEDKQAKVMEKLSLDIDSANLDFQDAQATRDPNSAQSKFIQDAFINMQKAMGQPVSEESVRATPGHQIYQVSPWMQKLYSDKLRLQTAQQRMDIQERRIQQADERLDIQRDREKGKQNRFDRAQGFKEQEKQEISDKQTELITQYDMGSDVLDRIEDQLASTTDFLGPYASRVEDQKSLVPGVERDPEFIKMQALVGDQLAKYVKQLSGTAVSDEERKRLEKNIPMMTDKPGEFKIKLDEFRKTLNEARERTIGNIEKQGKNPSAFKDKAQKQQSGDMVRMQIPDGRIKMIPRDKVEAAKKAGAKEM